jgi:cytochrome c oxidase subunit IV
MSHPEHLAADQEHEGQYDVHAHISAVGFYVFILVTLMTLTILTVAVSYVHLGRLNLIVAVVIASIKAGLVVTFFMHLKYDNKFNALILVVSLLFIGVFFAYVMNDTEHRAEIDNEQGGRVLQATGVEAPGGMEPHVPAATTPAAGGSAAPAGGDHGGGGHAPEPAPHH